MRMRLILAAFSLALAPAASLAGPAAEEPAFAPEAMKAHVDFLADDLLEGREAGTRGHEIAARYVATRFEAMGLRPGGIDGGWYQRIPFAEYELDPARPASLTIGRTRLINGRNALIAATPRAGNATQKLSGEIVFAGYGLEEDYAGLDVTGKFVAVLFGSPRGAPPASRPNIAGGHGALGLLYLIAPGDFGNGRWEAIADGVMSRQLDWLGPGGAPQGNETGLQASVFLNADAARVLFASEAVTADQLFASLDLPNARPKGFALRQRATIERTSIVHSFTSPNVIGVLPGSDPALKDEYVLLMAHLDHVGSDPALPGDRIYNGAMDNAAGTAAMLEAARGFVESGVRPRRSILFAAVTAEEKGLLGSAYLARYPVVGAGKVVGVVNLDMPVLLYDFHDVVAFGAEHSTLGPIVARAAGRAGVTLSPDPMPQENLFVRSDHYSFVRAGVPSVFLVTGFENGGKEAFEKFLATTYHQVGDDIGQPFDWQAGAKFARINYLIAREIADGDEPPRWYQGNPYGDRFAPGQPRAPRPEARTP